MLSKRQQSYSKVFKADLFGLMFLIRKGQKNKPIESTSKCSMGWFFGFKLHLICNERGELQNFMVTPGDVDDRKPLENKRFFEMTFDKLVADKGYISKNLFQSFSWTAFSSSQN